MVKFGYSLNKIILVMSLTVVAGKVLPAPNGPLWPFSEHSPEHGRDCSDIIRRHFSPNNHSKTPRGLPPYVQSNTTNPLFAYRFLGSEISDSRILGILRVVFPGLSDADYAEKVAATRVRGQRGVSPYYVSDPLDLVALAAEEDFDLFEYLYQQDESSMALNIAIPFFALLTPDQFSELVKHRFTWGSSQGLEYYPESHLGSGQFFRYISALPNLELKIALYREVRASMEEKPWILGNPKDFFARSFIDLGLLSSVPYFFIPPELKEEFEREWGWVPPDRRSQDGASNLDISYAERSKCLKTGHCEAMWQTTYETLLSVVDTWPRFDHSNGSAQGKTILIYVSQMLVGALKYLGDKSFLALTDVFDANGNPVLVRGGVYWLSGSDVRAAEPRGGRFPRWHTDTLKVYPRTFLFSVTTTWGTMPSMALRQNIADFPEEQKLQLWRRILADIDRLRGYFSISETVKE